MKKSWIFPQDSQKERSFGVAQCHKGLLAGNLSAKNSSCSHINPQCPGGVVHQIWVIVKNQHKQLREQLHQQPQGEGVSDAGF